MTSRGKNGQTTESKDSVPFRALQDKRVLKKFPKKVDMDSPVVADVGVSHWKLLKADSSRTISMKSPQVDTIPDKVSSIETARPEVAKDGSWAPPVWTSNTANQVVMGHVIDGDIKEPSEAVLLDTGAVACIISEASLRKCYPKNMELTAWSGLPLSSFHKDFTILGELCEEILLGETRYPVRWCVVKDDISPTLGMDFISYYRITSNWDKFGFDARINDEYKFIPMMPLALRAVSGAHTKTGKGYYVTCRVDGADSGRLKGTDLLVEPSRYTRGAFRTMLGVTEMKDSGEVDVFISNWDITDIDLGPGALLGYCSPVAIEGTGPPITASNACGVKSFEEYNTPVTKEQIDNATLGQELSPSQRKKALSFLHRRAKTFARNPSAPAPYQGGKFQVRIDTGDAPPTKERLRKMSPIKAQEIARQVKEMFDNGVVSKSNSPWASPVVLAKKSDGTWRFCVDYRGLNRVTKKDAYPLPPIQTILDALGIKDARVWSTMDAASGFWQLSIKEDNREKTAFATMYGLYEFNVMPFGLHGAPAAFCRAMDETLRDLLWRICLVFVDDIIVWGSDFDDHLANLEVVFDALDADNFTLKLSKCRFFMRQIKYIGHIISEGTLRMDPDKVEAILKWPPPTKLKELQSFLGAVNWYRSFIESYYDSAIILQKKLSDKDKSPWTMDDPETLQGKAFIKLKACFAKYPILRLPDWDKPFYVITDASDIGSGAILAQEHDGFELPVSYYSRPWKDSEKSVHSYVKETRAMVRALKHYKHYLWGVEFFFVTDCRALAHWNEVKEVPAVVERHLSFVQSFMAKFIHRAGTLIPMPDALSRIKLSGKWEFSLTDSEVLLKASSPGIFAVIVAELDASPMKEYQRKHRFTNKLITYLTEGKVPDNIGFQEKKEVISSSQGLEVINGLLVRKQDLSSGTVNPRIYLPAGDIRDKVLRTLHDDPLSGHLGAKRTMERIERRFYWPTLDKDVRDYVGKCHSCKTTKAQPTKKTELIALPFSGPWLDVHLDFMVMPAKTQDVNRYLLVIIDRYTKYVELIPTQGISSEEASDAFKREVLLRHGCPITVTTDGGSHFKGAFEKLLKKNSISHQVGLPDRHRSNGLAERIIRSIREYLRHYAEDDDWSKWIRPCQFALNSALSGSLGTSPIQLYTGRDVRLPLHNELQLPALVQKTPIMESAERNMEKSQEAMKSRYNKDVGKDSMNIGDLVMARNHNTVNKLEVKSYGPYRVIGLERPNVLLENPWVGKDSEFKMHLEDTFSYAGAIETRVITPAQDLPSENHLWPTHLKQRLIDLCKELKIDKVSYLDLIGKRVGVYWAQANSRGWWKGVVVDYDPRLEKHWIKYDQASKDGTQHYLQDMLGPKPGKWKLL